MNYDLYERAARAAIKQMGIDLDRPVPATEEYMKKRKLDTSKVKGIPYSEEEEQSVIDHINSRIDFVLDKREARIFNTMDEKPDNMHEAPEWVEHFPNFIKILTERLKQGHIDYGNKSFSKDPLALIEEVQEELLDIANLSFITYVRIAKIKSAIRTTIGGLHGELGDILGRYTEKRSEREQGSESQVRSSDSGQKTKAEKYRIQWDPTRD